ncbi:AraC family transcriptional regulator [Haematococcus lacustris]|uniref:AraC family transcriptional regulator n=1 Tax=Haematococcus lacustris TaxID=44745 RepID=A0A699YYR3_HAELA|nr:AraC family transcriptional regulator [Haematococcus lacustris]
MHGLSCWDGRLGSTCTPCCCRGAEFFLPVEVEGGLLSGGDCHAGQTNSEYSGTALESNFDARLRVTVLKANDSTISPLVGLGLGSNPDPDLGSGKEVWKDTMKGCQQQGHQEMIRGGGSCSGWLAYKHRSVQEPDHPFAGEQQRVVLPRLHYCHRAGGLLEHAAAGPVHQHLPGK